MGGKRNRFPFASYDRPGAWEAVVSRTGLPKNGERGESWMLIFPALGCRLFESSGASVL